MYCNSHFTPDVNHTINFATLLKQSVNFNATSTYTVHINEEKNPNLITYVIRMVNTLSSEICIDLISLRVK